MDTPHATYRRVPATFEEYLAQDNARPVGQAQCDCCGETRDCWHRTPPKLNPDTVCDACLRRHHAFNLAEEQKVRRLLTQLGAPGCRTLVELFDMWVDDRLPELLRGISVEIITSPAAG